jgi:hypothetical protein
VEAEPGKEQNQAEYDENFEENWNDEPPFVQ